LGYLTWANKKFSVRYRDTLLPNELPPPTLSYSWRTTRLFSFRSW